MKKHTRVLVRTSSILLLGGLIWLIWAPRATAPPVTVALVANSQSQPSSGPFFRITNGYERAILLTDLIVETNSPAGWRAFSHTVPTHPQRLAAAETKDLAIVAPTNDGTWRLRVTYGTDVKGPILLLGKAAYAVSQRAWPGQGFGIMGGSNSCISGESRR
jgi:hypothetical protein